MSRDRQLPVPQAQLQPVFTTLWLQTSTDVEELGVFLNEAVAAGTEGLIVKSLDSTYEPSKRSVNWLKLKKDYLEGVGDTFDLVPIGAWLGRCALLAGLQAGFAGHRGVR